MGRGGGKVTMKYIQNEKVRISAFGQRKKGLTKKVSDFSNSFGVKACLIVYDGDGDGKPITWPQNFSTLQSMLTKYEQQKTETTVKEFDVKDYFENKKNIVKAEILNVRKKIVRNKYPTWGRCFNNLEMKQLRGFTDIVDLKIQACNQRINMLKNMQQSDKTSFMQNTAQMQSVAPKNVASPAPQSSQPDDPTNPPIDIGEKNVFSSHSSQLDVVHSIPQMQRVPGKLDYLFDKSDQKWATQLVDFDDWPANKLNDDDKFNQKWTPQLMGFDDWAVNKLNDGDGCVKQPYVFEECQDVYFRSEIEQECATLDAFFQPRYGF